MIKVLYLIRGLPGSGKSSLARLITNETEDVSLHLEADQYFMKNGEYKYESDKIQEAHNWCQNECRRLMYLNYTPIVVSNTFTRQWEMESYYKMAEENDYQVVEVICKSSFNSVHSVPNETIQKMKDRFEFNL